jgi:hypothetical protein
MNGSDVHSEVHVIDGIVYNRTWGTVGSGNEGDEYQWSDEYNDEAIGTYSPDGNMDFGAGSSGDGGFIMPDINAGPLLASNGDLILAQVLGSMANRAKRVERIVVGPYTILTDGKKVNIQIRIQYTGSGVSEDVVSKFNEGIAKWWTGNIGKYAIQTSVLVVESGARLNIDVPLGGGDATMRINGRSGMWPSESSGWVAAHEIGHAFGLGDKYELGSGKPAEGYEDNIMGAPNKPPSEADITAIIQMARALARKRG